jgi:integrase/recombinase XerD
MVNYKIFIKLNCYADKRIKGFSPQTLNAYLLQSLLLIDYFKDVELELLDTNKLKEYLAISGKHLKPVSLAHRSAL